MLTRLEKAPISLRSMSPRGGGGEIDTEIVFPPERASCDTAQGVSLPPSQERWNEPNGILLAR